MIALSENNRDNKIVHFLKPATQRRGALSIGCFNYSLQEWYPLVEMQMSHFILSVTHGVKDCHNELNAKYRIISSTAESSCAN